MDSIKSRIFTEKHIEQSLKDIIPIGISGRTFLVGKLGSRTQVTMKKGKCIKAFVRRYYEQRDNLKVLERTKVKLIPTT